MTLQCCNLGSEYDLCTEHPVIERLFAETVAHQIERACRAVAKGKGEHSIDALNGPAHPFAADHLKQHLGIGVVAQRHPAAPEFAGQSAVAVNLPADHQRTPGSLVDARLRTAR